MILSTKKWDRYSCLSILKSKLEYALMTGEKITTAGEKLKSGSGLAGRKRIHRRGRREPQRKRGGRTYRTSSQRAADVSLP